MKTRRVLWPQFQEGASQTIDLRHAGENRICRVFRVGVMLLVVGLVGWGTNSAAEGSSLSLKTVPAPEPPNIGDYVKDKAATIRLGKALFWDMQVGNDGTQSCASCHPRAGADFRVKNELNPDTRGGSSTFQLGGPNYTVKASDFPFHKLSDPDNQSSAVIHDYNTVVASQGVFHAYYDASPKAPAELDPIFNVGGINTRRVTARNTPTVINAIFNYSNFWDTRANFVFNGANPFGTLDNTSGVYVSNNSQLEKQLVRIHFSSLASQAVGPPLDDIEMAFIGRTFPNVGDKLVTDKFSKMARRLFSQRPLAKQLVHPQDSILGPLSRAQKAPGQLVGSTGLNATYIEMITQAFQPKFWESKQVLQVDNGTVTIISQPPKALKGNQFTQMEFNFPLFFGLAIRTYLSTLVADDTPFDQYQDGNTSALTARQIEGMNIFLTDVGRCGRCHAGPELTAASVNAFSARGITTMNFLAGPVLYDFGIWNTAVRPVANDIAAGGTVPFINPLTNQPFPLSYTRLGVLKRDGKLPADVFEPFAVPVITTTPPDKDAMDGAFKTPQLRNVELTGPYTHAGGIATLRQMVEFYNRGGNFRDVNQNEINANIRPLGLTNAQKDALVDFLISLTDERVRWERAPFDHPQLFIPNGLIGDQLAVSGDQTIMPSGFKRNEEVIEIPAVGANGRAAEGLPAVGHFLDLDPFTP